VYPQLVHFGRFFLPTYGFLVSMGVLIGLWISVRNSERLGIDGEKAWNLGILVVLAGIIGAKVLYVINEWSSYAAHPSDIFSIATLQAGDFELLRTARRKALFNVSDQSLEEYLVFTQVMIGLINRLDLYKEFRSH